MSRIERLVNKPHAYVSSNNWAAKGRVRPCFGRGFGRARRHDGGSAVSVWKDKRGFAPRRVRTRFALRSQPRSPISIRPAPAGVGAAGRSIDPGATTGTRQTSNVQNVQQQSRRPSLSSCITLPAGAPLSFPPSAPGSGGLGHRKERRGAAAATKMGVRTLFA